MKVKIFSRASRGQISAFGSRRTTTKLFPPGAPRYVHPFNNPRSAPAGRDCGHGSIVRGIASTHRSGLQTWTSTSLLRFLINDNYYLIDFA